MSDPPVGHPGAPADHITPYDRLALDEASLIAALASGTPNEGLVEYFGEALHAELAGLARAATRKRKARAAPQRRVYLLPGIMGSQLGFIRGGKRPNEQALLLEPLSSRNAGHLGRRFSCCPRSNIRSHSLRLGCREHHQSLRDYLQLLETPGYVHDAAR
jgi:hypothetical protein